MQVHKSTKYECTWRSAWPVNYPARNERFSGVDASEFSNRNIRVCEAMDLAHNYWSTCSRIRVYCVLHSTKANRNRVRRRRGHNTTNTEYQTYSTGRAPQLHNDTVPLKKNINVLRKVSKTFEALSGLLPTTGGYVIMLSYHITNNLHNHIYLEKKLCNSQLLIRVPTSDFINQGKGLNDIAGGRRT